MTDEPIYVDYGNGFNREILSRLDLPLGEPTPALMAYMEQCVTGPSDKPGGSGLLKGFPVYAGPVSGIILAACGAAGVVLRLPQEWRDDILRLGAKDRLE